MLFDDRNFNARAVLNAPQVVHFQMAKFVNVISDTVFGYLFLNFHKQSPIG